MTPAPSTLNPQPSTAPLPWTEHPLIDVIEGGRYRKLTETEFAGLAQECGIDAAMAYFEERESRIAKAIEDPLNYGFELPHWQRIREKIRDKQLTGIPGGNNSAKSFFMGKLGAQTLTGKFDWPGRYPGPAKVLGVTQDEGASLQYQQPAVFMHLPVAVRKFNTQAGKKRSTVTKVSYSQANGFTEGTFVLPNRAQMWFKTVAQYLRDPYSFEGPSYHLILIDEGCPLALLELLIVRAAKVGGKVVYGHTCVHGMDATMKSLLQGARVVESLPMNWDVCKQVEGSWLRVEGKDAQLSTLNSQPSTSLPGGPNPNLVIPELSMDEEHVKGCPPGHFPFIMQPLKEAHGVIFPWCQWNPFQPAYQRPGAPAPTRTFWSPPEQPALFGTCIGQPKWKVRVKLFGWTEALIGARIGNFDANIHVIPHERIEKLLKEKKLTTYRMADPHVARSYFLMWKGVAEDGSEYLFDESPRIEEGEWVDANGEIGEGQRIFQAAGSKWYKKHIREREREHGVEAFRGFGDPRAFATQAASANGGLSLFDLFMQDDRDETATSFSRPPSPRPSPPGEGESPAADWRDPADDYAPMFFEPAQIRQTVDLDLERFVTALAYDRNKPLSVENTPKCFVSDRCQNFIRAALNFDGKPDSPYKDPIDAGARYGFTQETPWVDLTVSNVQGGGGWGR